MQKQENWIEKGKEREEGESSYVRDRKRETKRNGERVDL